MMTSSTKTTEALKPVNAAEIARQIYPLVLTEDKKVIARAFIEGAGCTEKGALTYVYNVGRQLQQQK